MIIRKVIAIRVLLSAQLLWCLFRVNGQVLINEIMPANISGLHDEFSVDKQTCPVEDCTWWFDQMGEKTWDGDYPDWIELYNSGGSPVDLQGYGLSDNPDLPYKWTFPSVTVGAGENLLVFASGKSIKNPEPGNLMHAGFKIDNRGETIILTDAGGNRIDEYNPGEVPPGFSAGRLPDGNINRVIFETPTPLTPNGGIVFNGYTDVITASHNAGFYPSPVAVTLSATTPGAQIRYTTDGSEPVVSSTLYSAPVTISQSAVLKCRAFVSGGIASKVVTSSYIVNETYSLPVVSLSTAPGNLWDNDSGIYVHGTYPVNHERIANYWQDWERPVTIEFFEADGSRGFSIPAGVKILGWGSRSNARKSLSVFFRDKYGEGKLNYPVFENFPVTEFKSLVLRAAGGDWQSTLIRDVFATDLIKDKNIDHQRFRPAILYINGEYWGIHNIREKINEDYLDTHYRIDKDRVDMISRYWRNSGPVVIEGSDSAYLVMENYVAANDMNEDEAFDYIKSIVDIDNFTDYLVPEIYYANYDWPGNNIKCWKPRTANSTWRWLLYDIDYAMGSHPSQNPYTHNTLAHATQENGTGWPNPPLTTLLIREMLEGEKLRNIFINRMADYMNSRFIPDTAIEHLNSIRTILVPEVQEHIDRWGSYAGTMNSVTGWNNNIDQIETFLENRNPEIKDHITDYFNTGGWDDLSLNIAGQGKIKINSIIPADYPWTGQYVTNIPVTVTALPEPGYRFEGWSGVPANSSSAKLTLTVSEISSLTANFVLSDSDIPVIVINEINYNSSVIVDAGDWIELYNPNASPVDISGWVFKDSDDAHAFILPENTILQADGYLVICQDSSDFEEAFPTVNNYLGEFPFSLSSQGETLRLFTSTGVLADAVTYQPASPWSAQANGYGPTLSLIEPLLDNELPSNWGYSIAYGTPGTTNDNFTYLSVPEVTDPSPMAEQTALLEQNFPNPFAEITIIGYFIPKSGWVSLAVFDLQGREVAIIENGHRDAGHHQVSFNASALPHGIYYYQLKTESEQLMKRMIRY
jgi:hypothetical protein